MLRGVSAGGGSTTICRYGEAAGLPVFNNGCASIGKRLYFVLRGIPVRTGGLPGFVDYLLNSLGLVLPLSLMSKYRPLPPVLTPNISFSSSGLQLLNTASYRKILSKGLL